MNAHGGNIRPAVEKYKLSPEDIIDFSVNINPLGFPERVNKIILDNIGAISNYPDPENFSLKKGLASYLDIHAKNLLAGNGSVELIFLIALALKPKKTFIPVPVFSEYERAVRLTGGRVCFLRGSEKNNFKVDVKYLLKHLSSGDMVFICNPNNPTGFLFDKDSIQFLAGECEKRGVFLVIDEVFMDFVKEKADLSMLKYARQNRRLLVLQSLTKFFALAGLRLGYLVGNENILKKIASFQPPWSVNIFAQITASGVIKDAKFIEESRNYLFKVRRQLYEALEKIGFIKPYYPNANFIFCKLNSGRLNSGRLCAYCAKRGIIIRDCSNFRGLDDSFIRIAVRKEEENNKLIKILKGLQ